jgi:hypothetical protein
LRSNFGKEKKSIAFSFSWRFKKDKVLKSIIRKPTNKIETAF